MCYTDTLPSSAQFPESMSFGRKDTHTHAQTDANNEEKSREKQTVVADEHGWVRRVYMLRSDIAAGKALKKNKHQ